MDFERKKFESVYSNKVKAGRRRTYFFDVRKTKGDDFYITITESTKRFEGDGYERHKIFLYKEDFNRFVGGLEDTVNHIKTELMPDYDYDEYDRRHEEYQKRREEEALEAQKNETPDATEEPDPVAEESTDEPTSTPKSEDDDFDSVDDEDLKW